VIELSTERLRLRALPREHAGAVADYHARNRAHLQRWEPTHPAEHYTAAFWRGRLEEDAQAAAEDRAYRLFLSLASAPARVVGQIHFVNVVRGAFSCAHLGYSLDRELEGQGLMHEALERALRWAFEELALHRVEANHRPENVRSAGLLRRLAFVPQGYARDYLLIDGAWRDHVLTALVNERWSPPGEPT
jgi:[ribosomal protein S5]-alanine N-acetyltransferase